MKVVEKKSILVIGGAGYVGSHFVRFAQQQGYRIAIMDNLSTGNRDSVKDADFYHGDLLDQEALRSHLETHRYHTIFHFAASCLVPESVSLPDKYYRNNVVAALNMLHAMRATDHFRLVFSSTCAVYGVPQSVPIREDHPKNPASPYGRSKQVIEWMLEDHHRAYGLRWAALRYFNAAGCEAAAGLGEDHRPETHLIPNVVRHALGRDEKLVIFGNDYPTPDGSCIRDYIHVTDLAEAHILAMKKLDDVPQIQLNLGTGEGISNLQVVEAVARITGVPLTPEIGPRRPGDPPELVADTNAAFQLLQWRPTRSNLEKIVAEVVQWMSEHPDGYGN
jgi:UDP-glucose 4-epimerase